MAVVEGEGSGWPEDEWDGSWDKAPPWFPSTLGGDSPDIELRDRLGETIDTLPTRSADILRRRLGLSPDGWETLREIGDSYGLSRERIRQIEVAARSRIASSARQPSTADGPRRHAFGLAFRSLPRTERGRCLRARFPEANHEVHALVMGPSVRRRTSR